MCVSGEWVYRIEYILNWGAVWGQTGFVVSDVRTEENPSDKSIILVTKLYLSAPIAKLSSMTMNVWVSFCHQKIVNILSTSTAMRRQALQCKVKWNMMNSSDQVWCKCVQENFRLCCTHLWQQLYIRQQRLAMQDNQRYFVQLLQKESFHVISISRSKKLKGWRQLLRVFRLPHPSKFSSLGEILLRTQILKRCL